VKTLLDRTMTLDDFVDTLLGERRRNADRLSSAVGLEQEVA
jgi:hypothetical protein